MTTGEPIGNDYPTLMPDLTDIADVQQAFKMYHFGVVDYIDPVTTPIAADSIEGHFGQVNERVTELEGRPVAGGQVTTVEPTVVGTPPQPVPEGYIWVDPSDSAESILAFPTVIYSPTDPSASLTMADVGTIWIDENDTADVLNVNDYETVISASETYQIKNKVQSDQPTSPVPGQIWMDIDTNTVYIFSGDSWVEVGGGIQFDFLMMGA